MADPRSGNITQYTMLANQRQIDAADRDVEQLVHELYCLTDDEFRIVEDVT